MNSWSSMVAIPFHDDTPQPSTPFDGVDASASLYSYPSIV